LLAHEKPTSCLSNEVEGDVPRKPERESPDVFPCDGVRVLQQEHKEIVHGRRRDVACMQIAGSASLSAGSDVRVERFG
jgi:hypothetical protein